MTTTSDTEYRREFFVLLAEKLKFVIPGRVNPGNLCFSKEEQIVIEYFFKDVSPQSVSANTSTSDCVSRFKSDLQKLYQGDSEILLIYEQAFEASGEALEDEHLKRYLSRAFIHMRQQRVGPGKKDWGSSENPWMR